MGWSDQVADLAKNVAKQYEELVTTRVRFDELRRQTNDVLNDFKHVVERFSDKLAALEKMNVVEHAKLEASIQSVSERLNSLSEQAMHAVAKEAAREVAREALMSPRAHEEVRMALNPRTPRIDAPLPPPGSDQD